MNPRKHPMTSGLTRRELLRGAVAFSAGAALSRAAPGDAPPPRKLADAGWCWDGQAINGQWQLSIFGGFLIDMHPEQAAWVRDFIKAN